MYIPQVDFVNFSSTLNELYKDYSPCDLSTYKCIFPKNCKDIENKVSINLRIYDIS